MPAKTGSHLGVALSQTFFKVGIDKGKRKAKSLYLVPDDQKAGIEAFYGPHLISNFIEIESGRKTSHKGLAIAIERCQKETAKLLACRLDRVLRNLEILVTLRLDKILFTAIGKHRRF